MRTIKEKIAWTDILNPSTEDIELLKKQFNFHPLILKELTSPSPRIRIESFEDYLFIVYHVPVYDAQTKTSRRAEIDFIVTKNHLITIHYEPLEQIDDLYSKLLNDEDLRKKVFKETTLLAVHHIFDRLIAFSMRQLRHVEEKIGALTHESAMDNHEDLLKRLGFIKRDILDYRLITGTQEKFFESLKKIGMEFWGVKNKVYLADLENENNPIHQNVNNYLEIVESLEVTNAQLLSIETNNTIKKFTVGAFLFSIPFFFVFLQSIPYISQFTLASPLHFWLTASFVILLVLSLGAMLRKKGLF